MPSTVLSSNSTRRRQVGGVLLRFVPLVAIVTFVAACSVIPAQEVQDPLGLHGEELQVAFVGAASLQGAGAELGAQAVTGSAGSEFQFDDLEGSLPVNPGTLANDISIATARLAPATEADAPETITLSGGELTVRVWQGAADYEDAGDQRVQYVLEVSGPITLTRSSCFAGECSYSFVGDEPALGTVKLSGNPMRTLLDIVFDEPSPNSGSVSLEVQAEPDTLAGKSLTVRLAANEGTVGF